MDLYLICASLFLFGVFLPGKYAERESAQSDHPIGTAQIYRIEQKPAAEISEWAADNNHIYVYYDAKGLLEVYDLGGTYDYSVEVYQQRNGIGHIGIDQGQLYIKDRIGNVYVFQGERQIDFVPREENRFPTEIFEKTATGYYLRAGKLYRQTDNMVVVDLRKSSVIKPYSNMLSVAVFVCLISVAFLFIKRLKHT